MSIRPRLGVEVPELTARVARASNPAGTTAMWVRDRLDGLWADEDFASWYPRDGRPGLSPAQLAAPVPAALIPFSSPSPVSEMLTAIFLVCFTPTRMTSERSTSALQDDSAMTFSRSRRKIESISMYGSP